MKSKKNLSTLILVLITTFNLLSQNRLYLHEFGLDEIELLNSPFKSAQDLNIENLMKYDVDRLLEPFFTQAGLSPKGAAYSNWDGLAGHVGGHYLSALAINYAATGDAECKSRLDYMIQQLKICQDANGNGYLGGVPNSSTVWSGVKSGNFTAFNNAWVPWYNVHKTYAGLRDAWLYEGNDTAREMFIKLCDWGVDIISGLSTSQMQTMLATEFGGMNEVYADAYQITGDIVYLETAKKFTHNTLFNAMAAGTDNLDNMHANTQIPKVIGFERVAQLDTNATTTSYDDAAEFFWDRVVNYRSIALGGNSRSEHFPAASACEDYVTSREGPESCNTYNMLKLSEQLFSEHPDAKYADFYERAMYNHILSTQHPEHGGYVYFTPSRPRHYRVYSDANKAMWCCVGSGMENHGKYGQFIYSHFGDDSLFVNLFVASELNWKEKGITIIQETNFPDADSTKFTIGASTPTDLRLLIRNPSWVKADELVILVNGDTLDQEYTPGTYVEISRTWTDGDEVKVVLPMHLTYEQLPNVSDYIALMYGPILLGAKTGTENLDGLVADDSRWGHIASGALEAIYDSPAIIGNRDSIQYNIERINDDSLKFRFTGMFPNQEDWDTLTLEPFFRIHDSRYMMYWLSLSKEAYANILAEKEAEEQAALELDARTIDAVATGEQQPEVDHNMETSNSNSGVHNNMAWRDASNGGYFSYELATEGKTNLALMVTYWGYEGGARAFVIYIDNVALANENTTGQWNVNEFVNKEYAIPNSMVEGKQSIRVKFEANPGNIAGGVFYLRLLESDETKAPHLSNDKSNFNCSYTHGILHIQTEVTMDISEYSIYNTQGQKIKNGLFNGISTQVDVADLPKGIYFVSINKNAINKSQKILIY